MIVTADSPHCR